MHILIVGGAGYIGSNMVAVALGAGHEVTVLDNLSTGHRAAVPAGAAFVEGSIADRVLVRSLFGNRRVDAVMHFAAFSLVGQSVKDPGAYYDNNVGGTVALLREMVEAGVSRFVFSSTAATFGEPETMPITEKTPQNPINPYGRSKLMVEIALRDFDAAYGLRSVALRYFNAAGVANGCGEDHNPETHLIPNILAVPLGKRDAIDIFGTDYPTANGTAIRDYIHVSDLCDAHLRALDYTASRSGAFNLGSGTGYSVREIVAATQKVCGQSIPVRETARRPGDPPVLVASAALAGRELGWRPTRGIEEIIASAWEWRQAQPNGYED